jgi:hypothetical protein
VSKISIRGIFRAYFSTLRNSARGRISGVDVSVQLVAPALLAIAYVVLKAAGRIEAPCDAVIDRAVSLASIVSGFLCVTAFMVFRLRVDLSFRDATDRKETDEELLLVDELYKDMLWAVVAGFGSATLFTLLGVASAAWAPAGLVVEVFAVAFFMNFCLVVCMCLKRMLSVYEVARFWSR